MTWRCPSDTGSRGTDSCDSLVTAYLTQVVEILDDRGLPQEEAVGDGLAHHEGGHQVLHGTGLAAVRTEVEGVEAAL